MRHDAEFYDQLKLGRLDTSYNLADAKAKLA